MTSIQDVIIISIIAFFLNLPFGWIRAKTRKFSVGWFICVHAPIPFVAITRILTHTPWTYIPLFFALSIAGQIIGARIRPKTVESELLAEAESAD